MGAEYYGLTARAWQNENRVGSQELPDSESPAKACRRIWSASAFHPNVSPEAMDEQNPVVEFSANRADDIQLTMRKMDRRQWWLWSYAMMVTLLLLMAVASFAFPALLAGEDNYYSFFLGQAVRGLVGMVLIFNVYVIYQQLQISRIRRQLTDQVFAVDKVEVLAQEVYKMALLDPLTGLFNRRYIEQRLEDEIKRSQRHGRALSVILFDLDEFKQVNDTYGHGAGDSLLKAFADRLSRATRGSDASARYGGDEFLVVLPECKPENVQHVLKRLEGIRVEIEGRNLSLALSAGWAELVSGESARELLARADAALYANKRGKSAARPQPVAI
jgi:diguanylate cyclase (GGDEF)-like protein